MILQIIDGQQLIYVCQKFIIGSFPFRYWVNRILEFTESFHHVISVPMKVRLKLVILAMAIFSCELTIISQEILPPQVNLKKK